MVIASRKMERLQETAQELNHAVLKDREGGVAAVTSDKLPVYPFECNVRKEEQVRI